MASKERRASRRFLMRLPLTVRWTDETVVGEAATESREVSSRGLYFHLPNGLKSGSPVEIVMTLPHELTQAGPVRVRCLGRVLRSSPETTGEVGVAAAIERYEFMRNGEQTPHNKFLPYPAETGEKRSGGSGPSAGAARLLFAVYLLSLSLPRIPSSRHLPVDLCLPQECECRIAPAFLKRKYPATNSVSIRTESAARWWMCS